jgi:hypothetical protein
MRLRAIITLGAGSLRVFLEYLGQDRIALVRRDQVAERAEDLEYLVGGFLDLADTLHIADRLGVVFNADAEQRERRDFQQFGQAVDRVELDDLAFFIAVECRARDAEPGRDFLGF